MSIFNDDDKFCAFYGWASIMARLRLDGEVGHTMNPGSKLPATRIEFLEGITLSVARSAGMPGGWAHGVN